MRRVWRCQVGHGCLPRWDHLRLVRTCRWRERTGPRCGVDQPWPRRRPLSSWAPDDLHACWQRTEHHHWCPGPQHWFCVTTRDELPGTPGMATPPCDWWTLQNPKESGAKPRQSQSVHSRPFRIAPAVARRSRTAVSYVVHGWIRYRTLNSWSDSSVYLPCSPPGRIAKTNPGHFKGLWHHWERPFPTDSPSVPSPQSAQDYRAKRILWQIHFRPLIITQHSGTPRGTVVHDSASRGSMARKEANGRSCCPHLQDIKSSRQPKDPVRSLYGR